MSEEMKFEKALEKLEKIVEDLETGNLALEDALKRYEEGIRLSALCQKKLSQAEKKIEVLTRTLDGSVVRENFEMEEEGAGETLPKKTARPAAKPRTKSSGEEEDVLL